MNNPAFHYCERTTSGLWAELLNTSSNLFFIIAALVFAIHLRKRNEDLGSNPDLWLLFWLTLAIGIGSGLWHSIAEPWTQSADIISIALFVSVYLLSWMVRVAGIGAWKTTGFFVVFLALNLLPTALLPHDFMHGSPLYLPTLLTLIVCTIYLKFKGSIEAGKLGLLTLLFGTSLAFRTVDPVLCDGWRSGTHFIWHTLNALLILGLLQILLRTLKTPENSPV